MLPVREVVPLAEPEVGGCLHDDEGGHVGHGVLHIVGAVRQPGERGGGRVDEVEQPPVLSSQPGHAAGDNQIFLQGIMRYFSIQRPKYSSPEQRIVGCLHGAGS